MKPVMSKFVGLAVLLLGTVYSVSAQCVMCRTAIEDDKDVAEGVNSGILYLMGIPYIILAVTLYFVIKRRRERKAAGEE